LGKSDETLHPTMKFEKKYKFETWNNWNDIIHTSSLDFYTQFHFYPNYLLANFHTFSQIDFIANIRPDMKANVIKHNEPVEPDEEIGIGLFTDKVCGFELQFCYEDEMSDKEFILIYDDEPDEDEEDDFPVEVLPVEVAEA
jgi:hypothetical protein